MRSSCPKCNQIAVKKLVKLRMVFFGKCFSCNNCGENLKVKGQWLGAIIGCSAGSLLLFLLMCSMTIKSWLPLAIIVSASMLLATAIPYYLCGFRRVGIKQFRI